MITSCAREAEVKTLLDRGHWPHACPAELEAHVKACRECRNAIVLTLAFRRERAHAASAARLESPGVLWWRAQLRRRRQAVERIERPLLGTQIITIVLSLLAAGGIVAEFGRRFDWLQWLTALEIQTLLPSSMQSSLGLAVGIGVTAALLASIAGAVIYSTSDRP